MKNDLVHRRVKDVMSKDVVTVFPDDTIHDALRLIVENRVSALPVVDARGHCVGMLSSSDLIEVTQELDDELAQSSTAIDGVHQWLLDKLAASGNERVSEVMSSDVAAVSPETRLAEVARDMLRNRVHRLPVVDHQRHLVGIVSTMDMLAAMAEGVVEVAET